MFRVIPILLLVALAAPAAAAPDAALAPAPAPAGVATYALVVGSNPGGPGQLELRYAEDDARRVGALLTELGGYGAASVDVVVHPTPAALRDRLTALGVRVTADLAAGRQARVFFYYSGHARAEAIDLGDDELPLAELRQRLFAIPATLTVVVLDACQSGAFSRIKGAAPAADFSFNSRQRLDASGIAVLASSSGSELSQESEQLRSSYFTHHLLVGLRGAGDANHDGQVTIDEAYQYAYHQTLLATAETAVGGQHVTFEADLKGHGEVALSFPRAATSAVVLPPALEGQALVEDRRAHTVVAETYKAKGAAVRIAVAPGDYDVLVRHGSTLSRCAVIADGAGGGELELGACHEEAIASGTRKGGGFDRPMRVELSGIIGPERDDGYTQTLRNFGYSDDAFAASEGLQVTALLRMSQHVWVGSLLSYVDAPEWSRDTGLEPLRIDWNTSTIAAAGRYELPFADAGFLSHLHAYGQIAAGLGIGRTHFADENDAKMDATYYGPAFSLAAGLLATGPRAALGVSLGYQLDYDPIISNLVGDTHASGGSRFALGLSYSY